MLRVKVNQASIEKSLKIFKKKFKDSGVVNELRERQQYTKKSTKKRQQKQKAIYNQIKKREEDE